MFSALFFGVVGLGDSTLRYICVIIFNILFIILIYVVGNCILCLISHFRLCLSYIVIGVYLYEFSALLALAPP